MVKVDNVSTLHTQAHRHTGAKKYQRNIQFISIMLMYNSLVERVENPQNNRVW